MIKIFRRYYRFLFRYKANFGLFWVALVLATVLGNLEPYFYKLFVDNISDLNYLFLVKLLVVLVIVKVLANLLDNLTYYFSDKVLIKAAADAKIKVFRHIQDLDFAFHVDKSTGLLISVFRRGDNAFFNLFQNINIDLAKTMIGLMILLSFFSAISPLVAVVVLVVFALDMIMARFLITINVNRRKQFNESEDKVSSIIVDNMINYETVKFFAKENKEERRLKRQFEDWRRKLWSYSLSFRMIDISVGNLSNAGVFVVFLLVLKKTVDQEITVGDFVMVAAFINKIFPELHRLVYRFRNIAKNYTDIRKYLLILDNKIAVKDPVRPVKIKSIRGDIRFEEVSFSYPGAKSAILKDVDLRVREGESVAFVGRSGAGKTTLVRLLMRFYDVDKGKITIDGVNIKKMAKSHLRSHLGVVPQEPILFNNTIAYNIAYGAGRVTEKEIVSAARAANLHKFITSLPLKYKAMVGERGVKLSGGQKQRLAIARMILSGPEIIIFDEATSSLDAESERLIQKALWRLARRKTTLIIAHRLSTVMKADKIVVIDGCRVVESGSHRALLRKNKGLYRHLWKLQLEKDNLS